MKIEEPTMTVIVDGQESERVIAGHFEDGLPYPEMFKGEVIDSFPWVIPMRIKQRRAPCDTG